MLKLNKLFFICIVLMIGANAARAQFIEMSDIFGIEAMSVGALHGNGCSMMDYTGDGMDDLTIAQKGSGIQFYRNENGALVHDFPVFNPPLDPAREGKSPLWLDYDNDGDKDFFYTQLWNGAQLYRNDNGVFTEVTAEAGINIGYSRSFGAAAGDYNKDGFLDIYICKFHNYLIEFGANYANQLFRNNGDGSFTDVTVEAGLGLTVQASFTAVFGDFDRDSWPDLYVVNDKIVQGNYYFRNNGDGTFSNISESSGSGLHMYAMSGTVDDYDNDNDLDIFISNEATEHALLNNDGFANFTDVAEEAGIFGYEPGTEGWAGMWIDYDNNQWQDLFICTYGTAAGDPFRYNDFFINQGDGTFTDGTGIAGLLNEPNLSFTAAMGDVNADGYYDFFVNNAFPTSSEFWMNSGGSNHFLSVELEGTVSNRDGVGAYIDLWAGGQQFTRYTHCGENYMGQNSGKEIFGLGAIEYVDSLKISWQSGITEVYRRIPVDQHLQLIEGVTHDLAITSSSETIICAGDAVTITAIGSWEDYYWSNGSDEDTLYFTQGGNVSLRARDSLGNVFESLPITIGMSVIDYLSPITENVGPDCFGGNDGYIILNPDVFTDMYVNNTYYGSDVDTIANLAAGTYFLQYINPSGCETLKIALILEPEFFDEAAITSHDLLCHGDNDGWIEVEIPGNQEGWQIILPESNGQLDGGSYAVSTIAPNGCTHVYDVIIEEPQELTAEVEIEQPLCYDVYDASIQVYPQGGSPEYSIVTNYEVFNSPPGWYEVVVSDAHGCVYSEEFEIIAPEELSAQIFNLPDVQDNDTQYGNGQAAIIISGGAEPYAIAWSTGDSATTTLDSLQAGVYSFIVTDANGCELQGNVTIDLVIGVSEFEQGISIYPNPANKEIRVTSDLPVIDRYDIYNASGKLVKTSRPAQSTLTIELVDLPAGLYNLVLMHADQFCIARFIKM